MRILVTGARAPVALEWARILMRLGHQVWLADSVPWVLSRGCRGVRKFITFPSPRFQSAKFTAWVLDTVAKEKIELILPTCEEVFYLDEVATRVNVFAPPRAALRRLHGKFDFQQMAVEAGLPAARTIRYEEMESPDGWWVKPEFSRFAVKGGPASLTKPELEESTSWIAQELLQGDEWCCYAVAIAGRISALASYRSIFRSGKGASVAFEQESFADMFSWVQAFAKFHQLTGQLSFDFMHLPDGRLLPLECNPRATSGLHLLLENLDWVTSLIDGNVGETVFPQPGVGRMLAIPMLLAEKKSGWGRGFKNCHDAVWSVSDPFPALFGQPMSLAFFALRALRHRISLNEAFTWDIEWNGN